MWPARILLAGWALVAGLARIPGKTWLLQRLDSLPPVCPMRIFFGLKCAFCGMTHAFVHFLFGDVSAATQENLFAFPLFALLALNLIRLSVGLPGLPSKSRMGSVGLLTLVVLLVYAVIRNLTGRMGA